MILFKRTKNIKNRITNWEFLRFSNKKNKEVFRNKIIKKIRKIKFVDSLYLQRNNIVDMEKIANLLISFKN